MSLLLIPLLPLFSLAGLLPQEEPTDEVLAEREVVVRVLSVYGEESAQDQENALASIAPRPLQTIVELLAEGRIPAEWLEDTEAPLPLDKDSLAGLEGALAAAPLEELRPFFETLAAQDPRFDRREICLDALAVVGTKRDIKLAARLATPLDANLRVLPRSARKSYEGALLGILQRDERGLDYLIGSFGELHDGLASASVDAIGGLPSTHSVATLAAMLGRDRGLDAYLLSVIAKLGPQVPHPLPESTLSPVRDRLTHSDPSVVRAAVRASGRLEDFEAIPQLLDMLTQSKGNLRTGVHVALGDITALPFRADERMWRAWYRRETTWWQNDSTRVFRELADQDPLQVSDAINEITRRRHLFRHELSESLLPILRHPETDLVVMACHSLEQLGSRLALPGLVLCLEHGDWAVRRAAWEALTRITGLELAPESEAWQSQIGAEVPR